MTTPKATPTCPRCGSNNVKACDRCFNSKCSRLYCQVCPFGGWSESDVSALRQCCDRMEKALRKIAYAEGEGPITGSWDEPASAEIARAALAPDEESKESK